MPPGSAIARAISSLRDSSISASRYTICARLYGVRLAHDEPALAAASTALRRSLRVHCGMLAKNDPSLALIGYVRPDSERMNSPPTYTFGVFATATRSALRGVVMAKWFRLPGPRLSSHPHRTPPAVGRDRSRFGKPFGPKDRSLLRQTHRRSLRPRERTSLWFCRSWGSSDESRTRKASR